MHHLCYPVAIELSKYFFHPTSGRWCWCMVLVHLMPASERWKKEGEKERKKEGRKEGKNQALKRKKKRWAEGTAAAAVEASEPMARKKKKEKNLAKLWFCRGKREIENFFLLLLEHFLTGKNGVKIMSFYYTHDWFNFFHFIFTWLTSIRLQIVF